MRSLSPRASRAVPYLLVMLVAAAAACSDTTGVAGVGAPSAIEIPIDTSTPVDPAAPTRSVLVMLTDGDEPVTEVARSLMAQYAPNAGARRDSIVPLEASRGFVAPLTDGERTGIASDERVDNADAPQIVTADDRPAFGPAGVGAFGQNRILMGATAASLSWALDRMTQRALPLDNTATFTGTGSGVTIYIVDTGIRSTHAEYAGRVTMGPDYIDGGTTTGDCQGHGTRVASDAAGLTMGTARESKIVAVRVLGCDGSGSSTGIVQALDWIVTQVAANPGPAVVNMSLGINGVCAPVNAAVARATAAGVAVVVAAGNSNLNACNVSPASAPSAITVGATDITDTRASFSNYGSCLDLYAPGASVDGAEKSGDNSYSLWSGTSAASPFVAGLAALYLEQFPTATPAQVSSGLVASSTPNVLKGTNATPNKLAYLPASSAPSNGGTGGGTTPGGFIAPPSAKTSLTCVRRNCTYDGRSSTDGVGITKYSWVFGDNTVGSGATQTHKYKTNGTFYPTLTISTLRGVTSVRQDTVVVTDGAPIAQATATCSGWTCTFNASRSTDDGTIAKYGWAFANASAASSSGVSSSISRTFKAAGTYTVTLTVTDDAGQTGTVQVNAVTTPRAPTPAVKVTCVARVCTFDGTGSKDDIAVTGYTWDFLDGTFQTGSKVTTTYASAGIKKFKLTVRNGANLSTSLSGQFTLK